jgi:hypothetical protein
MPPRITMRSKRRSSHDLPRQIAVPSVEGILPLAGRIHDPGPVGRVAATKRQKAKSSYEGWGQTE